MLILALGFNGPEDEIFEACGVKRSPAGMLADGGEYFTTSDSLTVHLPLMELTKSLGREFVYIVLQAAERFR